MAQQFLKEIGGSYKTVEYVVKLGFGLVIWVLDPTRFQADGVEGILKEYYVWIQLTVTMFIVISIISQAARNLADKEGKERQKQIIELTKRLVDVETERSSNERKQIQLQEQNYQIHMEYLEEVRELNKVTTDSTREVTSVLDKFNRLEESMQKSLTQFTSGLSDVKTKIVDMETRFNKVVSLMKSEIKAIKKEVRVIKQKDVNE